MIAQGRDLFARLITSELKVALYPLTQARSLARCPPLPRIVVRRRTGTGYADYVAAFAARSAVARAWRLFHEQYPLVLGPVVTMQPFEVGFDVAGR